MMVKKEIYHPIQNQAKTYFEVRRLHMQKIIQNNCILAYIKMKALVVKIELFIYGVKKIASKSIEQSAI